MRPAVVFAALLTAITIPAALRQLEQMTVRMATVWLPSAPSFVDARFRGPENANEPGGIATHVDFWLLNTTNVDNIRAGSKPNVQVIGPYSFRKVRRKLDVNWDRDMKVSSKEWAYYVPANMDASAKGQASLDAPIVTLNLPLIGIVERVHGMMGPSGGASAALEVLMAFLEKWEDRHHIDGIFVKRSAAELLYGYQDPLLNTLTHVLPRGVVPFTNFSLLQNMTHQQALEFPPSVHNTGMFKPQRTWDIEIDKGVRIVTAWPSRHCHEVVQGSDGLQFPPGLNTSSDLRVWVPELFRSYRLSFTSKKRIHGLQLLRFQVDPVQLKVDPCKCQMMDGLSNITGPMIVGPSGNVNQAWGPPVLLSNPFFCGADPHLREGIHGLPVCPTDDSLDTFLDIEPVTGVPVRVSRAAMLSSQITRTAASHVERHRDMPLNPLPILLMHEYITAPSQAVLLLNLGLSGCTALVLLARFVPLVLLATIAMKHWLRMQSSSPKQSKEQQPLEQQPLTFPETRIDVQAAGAPGTQHTQETADLLEQQKSSRDTLEPAGPAW